LGRGGRDESVIAQWDNCSGLSALDHLPDPANVFPFLGSADHILAHPHCQNFLIVVKYHSEQEDDTKKNLT
jgi:hypothetical protein